MIKKPTEKEILYMCILQKQKEIEHYLKEIKDCHGNIEIYLKAIDKIEKKRD